MTLREQIDADMKAAMKAREQVKLDTIRGIKSAIKYKEVEGGEVTTLDDAGILKIVIGLIKQRRDAAEQFRAGGRPELADKEDLEATFLQAYLPKQLSEAELETIVVEAIAEVGASSPKDMGAVMKVVQPKAAGRAEGRTISELVKKKLAGG
jgi:uncharacterized protein YqeY